jgi:integrase
MEGHIRKQGSNSWSIITFEGRDPATGRKRYKWRTVGGTRAKAANALRGLPKSKDDGTYVEPNDLTVADYLERWLRDVQARVAAKTFERYSEIVKKHLTPALGAHPLAKLAPLHLFEFYAKALARPLSARTVLHLHRVLSAALKQAVRWNLAARNVADAVAPPKVARQEIAALDEKQTGQLLEAAKGHALYAPVLLAVTTRLRRGELLALRWQDVDLDAGTLTVARSLEETKANGLRFKSPKSGRSRVVTLPQIAIAALKRHRAEQAAAKLRIGPAWNDQGLIFPDASGSPRRPSLLTDSFGYLARRAKLPGIHFHSLRNSAATQLFKAGVHPKIVSERLGHSKIAITLDTFSLVLPTMQQEAADKIDAALAGVVGGLAG